MTFGYEGERIGIEDCGCHVDKGSGQVTLACVAHVDRARRGPVTEHRMTVQVSQEPPQSVSARSEALVAAEAERLRAWATASEEERRLVQAVVRASLQRLLDRPGWIPASVRLTDSRVEIAVVVELDDVQTTAAEAGYSLALEMVRTREGLEQLLADLQAMGDDE